MVELRREQAGSGPIVNGFAGRGFRVGKTVFDAGLMLTPENAVAWDVPEFDDLDADALLVALGLHPPPEFLLLGSGSAMRQPAPSFRRALEAQNIGLEVMDSRAAARAWGVLRAEERWIAAALMPLF